MRIELSSEAKQLAVRRSNAIVRSRYTDMERAEIVSRVMVAAKSIFGATEPMICGRSKPRGVVDARLAVYGALIHIGFTTREVGYSVGHRDHSTVSYGASSFLDLITTDAKFRDRWHRMMQIIGINQP